MRAVDRHRTTGAGRDGIVVDASQVTLRPAVAADALCLSVLGQQVFVATYATDGIRASIAREVRSQFDPEVVSQGLAAPATRCIVAERNGHLIGFAHGVTNRPQEHVTGDRPVLLHRLYVQERFTGIGVGSALLSRLESMVRAEGFRTVWLTTWVGNARALGFYPSRGYVDVGATFYVFEDEAHENRVFAKAL